MNEQRDHEPVEENAPIIPGTAWVQLLTIDRSVVYASGLVHPLDYVVLLHARFMVERYHRQVMREAATGEPAVEVTVRTLWEAMSRQGILGAGSQPVTLDEVAQSLARVAESSADTGISFQGGAS